MAAHDASESASNGPNGPILIPNRHSAIGIRQSKGLVVLDVDGVIFPGQFMIALARRRGLLSFARTVTDCLLFNLGRIGLEELLRRSFGRLKGMPWETACEVCRHMPLAMHAAETIAELKAAGRQVILLTSGVPDPLVKELAEALGADGGAGTLVEVKDGRLTGRISGALARTDSKREFVARLIEREGIPWSHVVAVGDDPNNLSLMRRAGISIGFHAVYTVRREVGHLVESDDLADILPCALGASGPHLLPHHPSAMRSWYHEIARKGLHMSALAVPFLAGYSVIGVTLLLLALAAGYLVLEFWRVHGVHLPLAHRVTQVVLRRSESRRLATAPLTLGFGMLVSLWCLPLPVAQVVHPDCGGGGFGRLHHRRAMGTHVLVAQPDEVAGGLDRVPRQRDRVRFGLPAAAERRAAGGRRRPDRIAAAAGLGQLRHARRRRVDRCDSFGNRLKKRLYSPRSLARVLSAARWIWQTRESVTCRIAPISRSASRSK